MKRYKQLKRRIAICERRICSAHKCGRLVSGYFVSLGIAREHLATWLRWHRAAWINTDVRDARKLTHAEQISRILKNIEDLNIHDVKSVKLERDDDAVKIIMGGEVVLL